MEKTIFAVMLLLLVLVMASLRYYCHNKGTTITRLCVHLMLLIWAAVAYGAVVFFIEDMDVFRRTMSMLFAFVMLALIIFTYFVAVPLTIDQGTIYELDLCERWGSDKRLGSKKVYGNVYENTRAIMVVLCDEATYDELEADKDKIANAHIFVRFKQFVYDDRGCRVEVERVK